MPSPQPTYVVVAALIRRESEVLLIRQRARPDTPFYWALPGGVVKPGELLADALCREVQEETGLAVLDPGCLLAVAQFDDPEARLHSLTFTFEVAGWEGDLHPSDPDGFVSEARFLPVADAIRRLEDLPHLAMREPVIAHLRGRAQPGTIWLYRRDADGAAHLVRRLPPA